jgi:hypothetical protein
LYYLIRPYPRVTRHGYGYGYGYSTGIIKLTCGENPYPPGGYGF